MARVPATGRRRGGPARSASRSRPGQRDQPDARDGQREPEGELQRERGAGVARLGELGDRGRELGQSAITDEPQTRSTPTSTAVEAANARGLARQHAALTIMAALVVVVRPTRSASRPAATAPAKPARPTAANTTAPVSRRAGADRPRGRDEERRQPGPERVELPHVAEVAERRQTHGPRAGRAPRRRRRAAVRPRSGSARSPGGSPPRRAARARRSPRSSPATGRRPGRAGDAASRSPG